MRRRYAPIADRHYQDAEPARQAQTEPLRAQTVYEPLCLHGVNSGLVLFRQNEIMKAYGLDLHTWFVNKYKGSVKTPFPNKILYHAMSSRVILNYGSGKYPKGRVYAMET